ncbi:hypothetical protein [Photobacterium atrarenae]|uniref:Uncharacterized protein n=1 Tax=Photobacterium atrarenae TaxID=865757 RepID=A0ABY5GN72_9GAMM|nr:hypothetical protein [Photobacterium atrarenae]UTV29758.1 hypothetical protein NNL38_22380 [Photobacterium atrarenae]
MRKSHIALLVAVVSSPLALADDPYGYHNDPYSNSGSSSYGYNDHDDGDITVTDSFNKDIDKKLTVSHEKNVTVKDSYNSDDDTMKLYNVNNKNIYEFTDNSKWDYSKNIKIDIDEKYYMATSYMDGSVTYSDVTYGGACCNQGGWGHYGGDDAPSSVQVTHSNSMQDAYTGASGINIAGQNAGNNSLVQQSASTNAMLTSQ